MLSALLRGSVLLMEAASTLFVCSMPTLFLQISPGNRSVKVGGSPSRLTRDMPMFPVGSTVNRMNQESPPHALACGYLN